MTTAKSIIAALIFVPAISNPAHALIQKLCTDDYSQCVEKRIPNNQQPAAAIPPQQEVRDIWRMTCYGSDGAKFIVRSSYSARQLDTISLRGIVRHYVALSGAKEGEGFRVRAVGTGAHGANREMNAWFSRQAGTLTVTGDNPGSFDCGGAW